MIGGDRIVQKKIHSTVLFLRPYGLTATGSLSTAQGQHHARPIARRSSDIGLPQEPHKPLAFLSAR